MGYWDGSGRPWDAFKPDPGVAGASQAASSAVPAQPGHMVVLPPLQERVTKLPGDVYPLDINGIVPGSPLNPTLLAVGDDLIACVRSSVGQRNVLGVLVDKKLYSRAAIVDGDGIEDVRLFQLGGAICGVGSVVVSGKSSVAIFRLDGKRAVDKFVVESARQERNWVPAVSKYDGDQDRVRLVYTTSPLRVLDFTFPDSVTPSVDDFFIEVDSGSVRGGSQLLPFLNGWVSVVREVHKVGNSVRSVHRIARYDAALARVSLGKPFFFVDEGLEFCGGLVERDGKFMLAFGVGGSRALVIDVRPGAFNDLVPDEPVEP